MDSIVVSEIEGKETSLKRLLLRFLAIEQMCKRFDIFAEFYKAVFYRKMVLNEMGLAGINKTKKIAHIGSGPFPMTALYLAKMGIAVDCYDINQQAIETSKRLIEKYGKEKLITVFNSLENPIEYNEYDVIILSLHIIKKEKLIRDIIKSLDKGKIVVYRNPRGFITKYYNYCLPEESEVAEIKKVKQPFLKESVALVV